MAITVTKTGAGARRMAGIGGKSLTHAKPGGGARRHAAGGDSAFYTRVKRGGAAPVRIAGGSRMMVLIKKVSAARGTVGAGPKVRALRPRFAGAARRTAAGGSSTKVHFTDYTGNQAPPGYELIEAPYRPPSRAGLRFIARDILSGAVADWDLPLIHPEITYALSGPTMIRATIAPENLSIVEERVDAWATWIDVEEDGIIRASGICQPIAIDGDTLSIEAIGVVGYPAGLPFLGELSETQFETLDAVRAIWSHLLSFPDALPLNVELSRNVTGVLLGERARQDVEDDGTPKVDGNGDPVMLDEKPYALSWYSDVDCGREIEALATACPFDFTENPVWNADRSAVIHRIELGFPRAGTRRDDLRFVLDENLVKAFVVRESPGTYASQVVVRGRGEGRDGVRGQAGVRSVRRLRRVVVVTDKNVPDTERAIALAADELARRQSVLTVGEIVVHDWHPNAPIGSYVVGDDITVQAPISYLGDVSLTHRITAYTWTPDDGLVTLTLARSEGFHYGREPTPREYAGEEEYVADIPVPVLGDNSFRMTVMVESGTNSAVVAQAWITYGVNFGTSTFQLQAYGMDGNTVGAPWGGDSGVPHGFRNTTLADHQRDYMTIPNGAAMVTITGSVSTAGTRPAVALISAPKR
jgi:hypothetical protein